MPTYSYRCANCDFAFDQHQAFTDDSLTVCPNCDQAQLRKVFNAIGVSFKGSGFYRTDSRAAQGAKSGKHGHGSSSPDKAAKSGAEKSSSATPASASSSSDSSSSSTASKTPAAKPAASSPSGSSGK